MRTFVAAADSGSFTKAAPLVHRTQSAVSMQMQRLERDLGRTLFHREGRGVALTSEGDVLYRYARRLLALHDEALIALGGPRLHGVVRFGAPEDYSTRYLPGALQRFAAAHPGVQVDVFCDDSIRLRDKFRTGELDVALTTEERAGTVDSRPLPLAWLVAERGAPVDRRPLPLALYHTGCLYRRNALAALERAGIAYRVAYGSPSMTGVLAAIRAGLAVGPVAVGTTMEGCRLAMPRDGLPNIPPVATRLRVRQDAAPALPEAFAGFLRQELALLP
ncbi:LysR substrate-binding domain-containing protein [Desulfovibrio sp. Huiquan2017]|uniref:LysR substrate-binding domain-containing protein n=1 Tax=Desulfovibrio sp. Huiquan2017 TaxID=2816861 RepID=UPI002570F6FE|nr:LysR substrate-binding domain-containing protein [Desulfovibrio sp. Huiquan2017]